MSKKPIIKDKIEKNELIRLVAQDSDLNMKTVRIALNSIIDTIGRILENDYSLEINGFGIFYITDLPEQDAYDPVRKIRYTRPATKMINFKPGKNLKKIIK